MTDIRWCEKTVPELYTFNKMYKIRNGNVPIKSIYFEGNKECIDYAIKMQKECGIDVKYTGNPAEGMKIVIVGDIIPYDFTEFIKQLGFDGLDIDKFDSFATDDLKAKIEDSITKRGIEITVNDILIDHFTKYDDNTYHGIEEFEVFKNHVIKQPEAPKKVVSPLNTPLAKEIASDKTFAPIPKKEESKIEIPEPEEEIKEKTIAPEPEAEAPVEEVIPEPEAEVPEVTEAPAPEAEEKTETVIPEPEVEKVKEEAVPTPEEEEIHVSNVKTELTDEEIASNKELLKDIKAAYDECIKYIQDTCNASYRIILNKMIECQKNSRYNTQFCLMYMEVSNNYKTPLYKKLHDLDKKTEEYNKKLVHQVIELGCWNCNHTWKEDVTFVKPGPQYVKCPKCLTERPFDKR